MYICIYICVYIYMFVYVCVHINCVRMCTYTYVYVCIYVLIYLCRCASFKIRCALFKIRCALFKIRCALFKIRCASHIYTYVRISLMEMCVTLLKFTYAANFEIHICGTTQQRQGPCHTSSHLNTPKINFIFPHGNHPRLKNPSRN